MVRSLNDAFSYGCDWKASSKHAAYHDIEVTSPVLLELEAQRGFLFVDIARPDSFEQNEIGIGIVKR